MGRGPVRKKLRLEVDERRAQLLALGVQRFSRRAYDEVSIDEVARAAGISKGLVYHYFPTKRDFYVATLRVAAEQLLSLTAPDRSLPPLEQLQHGLSVFLDHLEAHGPAYAALLRGGIGVDAEVLAIVEETRSRFAGLLLQGLELHRPSPLLRTLLRGWIGFVEAASLDWLARRDLQREELRDLLVRTLVASLAAEGAAPEAQAGRGTRTARSRVTRSR